jgi:low affinity Fe/Cu permease
MFEVIKYSRILPSNVGILTQQIGYKNRKKLKNLPTTLYKLSNNNRDKMMKMLSHYTNIKVNVVIITSLIVSIIIIITNSLISFSPDENIRVYNAILISTASVGIALAICLVQIFRYKKSLRIQEKIREYFLSRAMRNNFLITLIITRCTSLFVCS